MVSKLKALGGCATRHLQGQGYIVAAPLQAAQYVNNTCKNVVGSNYDNSC